MNVNSLTIKAQEALQAAYTLAQQRGQQAIEPLHMLSVLIRDDDALCTFLLGRVGVNVRGLRDEADRAVGSLPQVTGGNGEQYFSQDAVIKLAPRAGIELDSALAPAEKLKVVQNLMEKGDSRARRIFASIGAYLAHTLKLYCRFYDVHHMIVLGRVMSGLGGSVILETCLSILNEEYPELAQKVRVMLPDEKTRRVGQSVAAASLPELRKNA